MYSESWAPKNWCFCIVVLEKTLESPLDCKEIQPVQPKGSQFWLFATLWTITHQAPPSMGIPRQEYLRVLPFPSPGDLPDSEIASASHALADRFFTTEPPGKALKLAYLLAFEWACGWMASLTRWTWVWVNSGSWWWTGRPGTLRIMGSQRVRHDWATELNWIEEILCSW